jgi:hypothetical protein
MFKLTYIPIPVVGNPRLGLERARMMSLYQHVQDCPDVTFSASQVFYREASELSVSLRCRHYSVQSTYAMP